MKNLFFICCSVFLLSFAAHSTTLQWSCIQVDGDGDPLPNDVNTWFITMGDGLLGGKISWRNTTFAPKKTSFKLSSKQDTGHGQYVFFDEDVAFLSFFTEKLFVDKAMVDAGADSGYARVVSSGTSVLGRYETSARLICRLPSAE